MAPPAAPPTIPDYEFVRELGRGGMGTVYLYHNRLMDRPEVVKLLSPEVLARPGNRERFQREIQSAARLGHPNIVTAYAAVRVGDGLAFCMEYVDGDDLAQVVARGGPLPPAEAAAYTHQAACGLDHAHEAGTVHRDIKPGNLMRSLAGRRAVVKIMDFGLAKAAGRRELDGGTDLTRYGQVLGTPDFIAPEQIRNTAGADIRADLYSLGCTLYFLLAGRPPFKADSLFELFELHVTADAPPLDKVRPGVPADLAAVAARLMAKDPAARFQTPAEVVEALSRFAQAGTGSHPRLPAVARDDRATKPFTPEPRTDTIDTAGADGSTPEPIALSPDPGEPGAKPNQNWREPAAGSPGWLLPLGVVAAVALVAGAAWMAFGPRPQPPEIPSTPTASTSQPPPPSADGPAPGQLEQGAQADRTREVAPAPRPVPQTPKPSDGFVELFGPGRGRPPTALWRSGPAPAVGPNGLLAADGQAVLFDGGRLGDFDLEAEVDAVGGAGLLVRGEQRAAEGTPTGYLIGLGRADDPGFVAGAITRWGSRSGVRKPLATGDPAWNRPGEPVTLRVEARGEAIVLRVGGRPEVRVSDAAGYGGGRIGLATLPGGSLAVRRLAVKPVRPPDPPAAVDDPGFTPLVAPDTLAGWLVEQDRDWEANGGVLSARQPGAQADTRGSLLSADEYADFALRFDYWLEPKSAALVCIRAVPGEQIAAGDRKPPAHPWVVLNSADPVHRKDQPTGTLHFALDTQRLHRPDARPALADRTWHEAEVVVRGRSITVTVGGQKVNERAIDPGAKAADPPDFPAGLRREKGRVGFTPFAGELRVREVRVKRL